MTDKIIVWLMTYASADDVFPGVTYVGNNRGTQGCDWDIKDTKAFLEEIDIAEPLWS